MTGSGRTGFKGPEPPELNARERRELARLAWGALESYLTRRRVPFEAGPWGGRLDEPWGVFVTLELNGVLRGCVGTVIAERPLGIEVQDRAVAAATKDPRFPPVRADELPDLSMEISVLSPLAKVTVPPEERPRVIEVGRHGLFLRRGLLRGLLLPQVAVEHGWDAEEFLAQTAWKAGLDPEAWKEPDTDLFVFTATRFDAPRPETSSPAGSR